MFDKYLIGETGFRNIEDNGAVTGFAIEARLGYYRGLGLSMVEELEVTVDGEKMPPEAVRLIIEGKSFNLAEREVEYSARWEMGDFATIAVDKPGGLPAGEHKVELKEGLRISYLPFLLTAGDAKTLRLEG
jgi:hypothetical protein